MIPLPPERPASPGRRAYDAAELASQWLGSVPLLRRSQPLAAERRERATFEPTCAQSARSRREVYHHALHTKVRDVLFGKGAEWRGGRIEEPVELRSHLLRQPQSIFDRKQPDDLVREPRNCQILGWTLSGEDNSGGQSPLPPAGVNRSTVST